MSDSLVVFIDKEDFEKIDESIMKHFKLNIEIHIGRY